jgi:hypothetical protein
VGPEIHLPTPGAVKRRPRAPRSSIVVSRGAEDEAVRFDLTCGRSESTGFSDGVGWLDTQRAAPAQFFTGCGRRAYTFFSAALGEALVVAELCGSSTCWACPFVASRESSSSKPCSAAFLNARMPLPSESPTHHTPALSVAQGR